jgi:hypothetical protein
MAQKDIQAVASDEKKLKLLYRCAKFSEGKGDLDLAGDSLRTCLSINPHHEGVEK